MRCLMVLLAWWFVSASALRAEDQPLDNANPRVDIDQKLSAFCLTAILRDRGLACSPFAGSTDAWILTKLVKKEGFLAALKESKTPAWLSPSDLKPAGQKSSDRSKSEAEKVYSTQRTEYSDQFRSTLTADLREKLPMVYLRIEGAMALCRPEFAQLFEDANTQLRIRKFVNDISQEKSLVMHQALFVLTHARIDEAPIYQAELRKISADTDLRIVQMLTATERERLWEMLLGSKGLDAVVEAPPSS